MASALELYPSDADLWLEFGGTHVALSDENLFQDADMELADTSKWVAAYTAVLSKEADSPYSGTRVLRVTRGGAGNQFAYQGVAETNVSYRARGWARGDGTNRPLVHNSSEAAVWTGTTSTAWQYFDVTFTAPNNGGVGLGMNNAGAGYAEFDSVLLTVASPRFTVIDNLAERGGAPRFARCGNGVTASTSPTQLLNRRGMSFDGGDWIDCGLTDRYDATDPFTLVVVSARTSTGLVSLLGNMDTVQSYRGISLQQDAGINLLEYYMIREVGVTNLRVTTPIGGRAINFLAVSNAGTGLASGVKLCINGSMPTPTIGADTLTGSTKTRRPFLLGARHSGTIKSNFFVGNMYFAAMFPRNASALQLQNLYRYVMSRINL